MLNITHRSVDRYFDPDKYKSFDIVKRRPVGLRLLRVLFGFLILAIISMFLPWTQNIQATGDLTALSPEKRQQTIQSIIGGRIEKWYVQEGQQVNAGDTIVFISEIKESYLDPKLIARTQEQRDAKASAMDGYKSKVSALSRQRQALVEGLTFKLNQARNYVIQAEVKVEAEKADLTAAEIQASIAETQFYRIKDLFENGGLKSRTDLEEKKLKLQETQAKLVSAQSKLRSSQQALTNATIDLSSIEAQYQDKIAKVESDKYTAVSALYDTEAQVSKLNNQISNYELRNNMYYITAPVDGYVTQAIQRGVGETIKEGASIATIIPENFDVAAAIYIRPIDIPLIKIGKKVQLLFDGWPAIVFSGWPGLSYGSYTGEVVAVDRHISENGMFRVLVRESPEHPEWPDEIRVGGGVRGQLLLNDVSVWYEIWRQLNGFPPDYYTGDNSVKKPKDSILKKLK